MRDALQLPDSANNWVDRYAPARLRAWLRLGRFDRPAGIWLLMLPGWQALALTGKGADIRLLALFALGAAAMRAAGCAYNDIVDRDLDAKVARTAIRPIPSGQISVRGAWIFLVACSLLGLAVLLQMNGASVILGVLSLGLVAGYPFMKRITWWPQAWLGLTFNWGALVAYAAVAGKLTFPALLLYIGGIAWTLGYDTIYAVQDLEDDALAGVKSTARRLGSDTKTGVMIFYVIASLFALAAAIAQGLGPGFYPIWLLYVLHFGWQIRTLKLDDPMGALRLFRANRDAGLLLFAAFFLGAAV